MNRYIAGGLAWCMLSTQAVGLTLSPLVIELNTDQRLTSQVTVTNNSTQQLALETSVHQLIFQGDESFDVSNHEDKNILIFPPAALLEPGQNQVFRIQWVSNTPLQNSESYFIRFSSADVKQNKDELNNQNSSGINIKLNYNALLHIYSTSFNPEVSVHITKNGKLTLKNSGKRYTFSSLLHFKGLDIVENNALINALGTRFIAPQSTITLNSSMSLPVGTYYGFEK